MTHLIINDDECKLSVSSLDHDNEIEIEITYENEEPACFYLSKKHITVLIEFLKNELNK